MYSEKQEIDPQWHWVPKQADWVAAQGQADPYRVQPPTHPTKKSPTPPPEH
jgi:hypothetical protein